MKSHFPVPACGFGGGTFDGQQLLCFPESLGQGDKEKEKQKHGGGSGAQETDASYM